MRKNMRKSPEIYLNVGKGRRYQIRETIKNAINHMYLVNLIGLMDFIEIGVMER